MSFSGAGLNASPGCKSETDARGHAEDRQSRTLGVHIYTRCRTNRRMSASLAWAHRRRLLWRVAYAAAGNRSHHQRQAGHEEIDADEQAERPGHAPGQPTMMSPTSIKSAMPLIAVHSHERTNNWR